VKRGRRSFVDPINDMVEVIKMNAIMDDVEEFILDKRLLIGEQQFKLERADAFDTPVALQRLHDSGEPGFCYRVRLDAIAGVVEKFIAQSHGL
jgi:hypothetical protein